MMVVGARSFPGFSVESCGGVRFCGGTDVRQTESECL